jgi:hypothetical protein
MYCDQNVPGEPEANGLLDPSHGEAVQAENLHAVRFVATPMALHRSRQEALTHKNNPVTLRETQSS